jgi:hypothetical protein
MVPVQKGLFNLHSPNAYFFSRLETDGDVGVRGGGTYLSLVSTPDVEKLHPSIMKEI